MKMLKKIVLMAALVLLATGCGTSEQEQKVKTGAQGSNLKSGIKHVEAQKSTEKQEPAAQPQAAQVSASAAAVAPASAQEAADTTPAQKTRAEMQSSEEPTPERTSIHTIVMQNKYGKVAFNHAAHTEFISCSTCHPTEPPSRIEMSRKEFHAVCRTCHNDMGAGPVKCSGCHTHRPGR